MTTSCTRRKAQEDHQPRNGQQKRVVCHDYHDHSHVTAPLQVDVALTVATVAQARKRGGPRGGVTCPVSFTPQLRPKMFLVVRTS